MSNTVPCSNLPAAGTSVKGIQHVFTYTRLLPSSSSNFTFIHCYITSSTHLFTIILPDHRLTHWLPILNVSITSKCVPITSWQVVILINFQLQISGALLNGVMVLSYISGVVLRGVEPYTFAPVPAPRNEPAMSSPSRSRCGPKPSAAHGTEYTVICTHNSG